jgi:DNA repair protein RAD16
MRLAANHPDLVTTKFKQDSKYICVVCNDEAEDAILSKCKHIFCREDARIYLDSFQGEKIKCPDCFLDLQIDLTQEEVKTGDSVKNNIISKIDLKNWRSSTKIESLVEELQLLKNEDSTIKSIVFSQFTSFLDLCHWRLVRAGFQVVKLDGRMGPGQRDHIIKKFSTDPTVTVFLVSLKAGGVALNLTEASRVFIMDPWYLLLIRWNPAVEAQAMDRIHRLGQYRPIKITRMIIENSIESRIIELQEKKQVMFDSTIGGDSSTLQKVFVSNRS